MEDPCRRGEESTSAVGKPEGRGGKGGQPCIGCDGKKGVSSGIGTKAFRKGLEEGFFSIKKRTMKT